jgi:tripartite-type tricarboxylate transporter receptor subunit TctC
MHIYDRRRGRRGFHTLASLFVLIALLITAGPGWAQGYPTRPIKIIVSNPPGGTLDLGARLLARYMQEPMGQSVVVENHTGGEGIIAMRDVQRAAPDGYTLGVVSGGSIISQPIMRDDTGYSYKDFTPIGMMFVAPMVFLVPQKSRFQTLAEFIAYARQHPGELSYGAAGLGGSTHIGFEVLKQMAGINVVNIPYRGSAPARQDLIGGRIAIAMEQLTGVSGLIQGGTLRPLAVSSLDRIESLPGVPAVQELGYKGYDESTWLGLVGPAQLAPEVRSRLESVLGKIQKDPAFIKQLSDMGAVPRALAGPAFGRFLGAQNDKFAELATRLGLRSAGK